MAANGPWNAPALEGEPAIPMARPVSFGLPAPTPDPLLLADLNRSTAWADLGILVVAVVLWDMAAGFVLSRLLDVETGDEPLAPAVKQRLVLPLVATRAVGSMLIVAGLMRLRRQGLASIGLRKRGILLDLLFGLVALGAAAMLIYLVMSVVVLTWPEALRHMEENSTRLSELVPHLPLVGYLGLMGVVGLYEEVLFRGFLMPRLRRGIGNWPLAVLVSTTAFTLPHAADQTGVALIPIAVLSLVFSVTTILRRSLLPGIIAHALFNFSVILIIRMSTAGS